MYNAPLSFDVVDLDPYGSASPFLDGAVQSVKNGGTISAQLWSYMRVRYVSVDYSRGHLIVYKFCWLLLVFIFWHSVYIYFD